ncbi:MAG: biotin/lipoyl-binding protein, partial [Rhodospirillaceae bacterium]|nr:biotin/lipoyl-binding protein [Rhodospirillaceae bacterium]
MSKFTPLVQRRWIKPLCFVIAAIFLGLAGVEGLHWWRHVDEPNAQVEADFTLLSSSVNATVETIHVKRGDRVEKGAVLASMDTAVAELDVATQAAEVARQQAAKKQIEAERSQYKREMNDKIATARAAVDLQRLEHATWTSRRAIAQSNVDRKLELVARRTISERQVEDARDRLLDITSKIRSLETSIQTSEKKYLELTNALYKETVFDSRMVSIDRTIDKINVQLRQSKQRLIDMHIHAPISGIIDEVYV